jgi:hypothetical protein
MTGSTLETFALVIVTAIILALVQEGVKRLFKKTRSGEDNVTRDELVAFCQRQQSSCSAKQVVEIIRTSMTEMRLELKTEMSEIRKLVMEVIRNGD